MKKSGVENGLKRWVQFFLAAFIAFQATAHASEGIADSYNPCSRVFRSFADLEPEFREAYKTQQRYRVLVSRGLRYAWNNGLRIRSLSGRIKADKVVVKMGKRRVSTLRLTSAVTPGLDANPQGNILFLHGLAAASSELSSMGSLLYQLSRTDRGSSKSMARHAREKLEYQLLTGEAIAMPGHDGGPALMSVEDTLSFLAAHIQRMKKQKPDMPLHVFTRSGSGNVVARLLTEKRFSHIARLVDGVIMMSPPWSGDPSVVDGALDNVKRLVEQEVARGEDSVVYPQLMNWVRENQIATDWAQEDFGGKPVLILLGEKDLEVTELERNLFKQLDQRLPNVRVVDIEDAGHDTFREKNRAKDSVGAIASYKAFYNFLASPSSAK